MENISVNSLGHLTFCGMDTLSVARDFGTPLYVMDEVSVRKECRKFKDSITEYYDGKGLVCYASKALCCVYMCRLIAEEGLGLDVSSAGEIYTALKAGFDPEKIVFHGNFKTDAELDYALENKIGRIEADGFGELRRLAALAAAKGVTANVLLRVKPGVDAHTHEFIQTGQIDSKFGVALENGEAFAAVKEALSYGSISLKCLGCHIGSQIFEIEPFCHTAEIMLEFAAKIKNELGYEVPELNLGGGFGIKYTQVDTPADTAECIKAVSARVKAKCKELGLDVPFIMLEPGRKIVGDKGLTLYTVGEVKEIPNVRTYVIADGGMTDNPRYMLYQAEYEVINASRADKPKDSTVTVCGRTCESGDKIGEGLKLQQTVPGDILAVLSTGAYNYSMSSNYNRIPKPAAVFIKDNRIITAVRRQTLDDVISNDVL
ncbi:MAG: diaminopimelate decarboxylase [Oscillospiraceae bacterium]|jgi:diaminopimelate decarboxylase|nr:diaminopimelate decarboxylase [Oscillospiraceae bacterium]